jgi:hypothetical protein
MFEQRLLPRYPLQRSAEVLRNGTLRYPAITRDIARGGVGLEVDSHAVAALAQGGTVLTTGDQFDVRLSDVPAADGRMSVLKIRCQAHFVRRLSQNRYVIGAKFIHFDSPESEQLLDALVKRCCTKG